MLDPIILRPLVSSLVRYALVSVGVTYAVEDDGINQLAGAIVTAGLVIYSVVKGIREAQAAR